MYKKSYFNRFPTLKPDWWKCWPWKPSPAPSGCCPRPQGWPQPSSLYCCDPATDPDPGNMCISPQRHQKREKNSVFQISIFPRQNALTPSCPLLMAHHARAFKHPHIADSNNNISASFFFPLSQNQYKIISGGGSSLDWDKWILMAGSHSLLWTTECWIS